MPIFRRGGATKHTSHTEYMEKLEAARKARRPFERDWWLNLAFLANLREPRWDIRGGRLLDTFTDDEQDPELRVNGMFKIMRIEKAKLLKNPPVPEALPVTTDEEDMSIARQVNAYFRYVQDEWKFRKRMRDAMTWLIPTGNVFIKWHWPSDEEAYPCMDVVSPFEMYITPLTKSWPPRWVIHAQFMDPEEAVERYAGMNTDGDKIGANLDPLKATTESSMNRVESRILGGFGDYLSPVEGVMVYEYWEAPRHGKGGHFCVFTDAGIVATSPFPYEHGKLPFTHIGHVQRGGVLWHDSVLSKIRPLNEEMDRAESQVIYNRAMSNAKFYIPPGLELNEEPDARPGQILYGSGDPNLEPKVIAGAPFPDWVSREPARYLELMSDLAGQHEVSQGGVPGRIDSAQGVQLLQETDDMVLKEVMESRDEAIADGFFMVAALAKQYAPAKVVFGVYDKDGMVETTELLTDQIPLNMRVRVQSTTGLPQTIAGKWDRILNLWQYKVVQDPNWVLEQLDLSPDRTDLDPMIDERKRAHRENLTMASGEEGVPLTPDLFDDHKEHRKVHLRYMRADKFKSLHPRKQKVFEFHMAEHNRLEKMVVAREAELQAIAQGAMLQSQQPDAGVPANPEAPPGPPTEPTPPPATDAGSPAPVA